MITIQRIILAVLLALVPAGSLRAQQKQPLPLHLTLQEAVRIALRENPEVQIANLDVVESRHDRSIVRSALLPQASIGVSEAATRRNLDAFIGFRIPGFPQHIGPFRTFQAGPAFSFPVFDLTLWHRLEASSHRVTGASAQELTIREQTTLLVVSQYLGCLRAAADVRAAQSRVQLAQALYDQAEELQKQGLSTALDTLRSSVELQNEKQRLIVTETQGKTALYGLAQLLDLDPRQTVELDDETSFFGTPKITLQESMESAYANRPEIKALVAQEKAAHLEQQAAKDERLPKVEVNGAWGYQGTSLPASIPAYQFQVTLDVPLFTGGRIRAENAKAQIELKKIARQTDSARSRIALEVKTAIAQLDAARNEVAVANLGLKLANDEVVDARERFQSGVANNIEVTTAQDALSRASDNQISALYRYNLARADLAHATGQIERFYTH
ncbi:MAG: TolC family protein [Acidobacteria bacterium]|nr:MAG: TolC family protein [Acidobacteriota bacterium]